MTTEDFIMNLARIKR